MNVTDSNLRAKYEAVLGHLDERSRWLVLGAEARLNTPTSQMVKPSGDLAVLPGLRVAHQVLTRTLVYQRSLPLATEHLQILTSRAGERAGVVGAAALATSQVLSRGDRPRGRRSMKKARVRLRAVTDEGFEPSKLSLVPLRQILAVVLEPVGPDS